ncbi:MAG: 16S rRNA (uracil(1498)-N(3))-methyltransferase [Muribaculaceae bacterium]|nr:16S rRNA (uracil(1498)-N(3))-methyltransferase [Muribaculaceae bacterium]
MHQFFAPEIATTLTLPQEESQHAIRVLRLVAGNEIEVVDGCGTRYRCRITLAHQKHCGVEIIETISQPNHWKCNIILGIAPTKNNDRIEWSSEKCTEAGIDRIIPLKCRYSERKELKTDRINKILISAMKQSLKSTLPQLDEMTPIKDVLDMEFSGQKFIAYCDKNIERKVLSKEYKPGSDVVVLIGPEGDFSPEEVDYAISRGFIPITLGDSRFRTETAAVFACFSIHAINQLTK